MANTLPLSTATRILWLDATRSTLLSGISAPWPSCRTLQQSRRHGFISNACTRDRGSPVNRETSASVASVHACGKAASQQHMLLYETKGSCRWEVVESGAGAPYLLGASLPPGKTGPQVHTLPACCCNSACTHFRAPLKWSSGKGGIQHQTQTVQGMGGYS